MTLRPSEVALACGVSTDTLRHYERLGVIPAAERAENGYRQYPQGTIRIVQVVQAALAIGFTLEELARILKSRRSGSAPCRSVQMLASEKLLALEREIARLTQLHDRLAGIVAQWDTRLTATPAGQPAHLLDSLADLPPVERRTNPHKKRGAL